MSVSNIAPLLNERFQKIIGLANETVPSMIDRVFTRGKMDGPIEDILSMEAYTMPQIWNVGTPPDEMSAGTSFTLRTTIGRYAGMVSIPIDDLEHDPTRTLAKLVATNAALLIRAFMSFREMTAATWLATGFSNVTGLPTIDGCPMFYNAHPYSQSNPNATYSNRLASDPPLNPTSLQDAINLYIAMTDSNAWERIRHKPSVLLTNPTNHIQSHLTLKNPMEPNSANRNYNTSLDWGITLAEWEYLEIEPTDFASQGTWPGWILLAEQNGFQFKTLNGFKADSDVSKKTRTFEVYMHDDFVMSDDMPQGHVASIGG